MKRRLLVASGILIIAVAVLGTMLLTGCKSDPELLLEVTSPQDESVVSSSEIAVSGNTDVDAVVSINGDLVDIDAEGKFNTTITLEEGPNYIEVVASNYDGEESSEVLTVIYVA